MNKNTYVSLALIAFMEATSSPLLAQVQPAPHHPVNIAIPAVSMTAYTEAVALNKEQAAYHQAMMEHYKSLIAAEYERGADPALNKHHQTIGVPHETLSKEHLKTAAAPEAIAKSR